MTEKIFETASGKIHYWLNDIVPSRKTLVFLPGLTADHHLFDKQTEVFEMEYNLLTWDAPGHAASRPFRLDFSLMDKAVWLHAILEKEGISNPILIGQSMGGYVSQCFMQKYPGEAAGFISVDSAPLKRSYVTGAEIWLLKRTAPMFRVFPWKALKKLGTKGCAETACGRQLMEQFIGSYTKDEYCRLAGHGYRILAEAMEADLPYRIDSPAILLCGEKDRAGSAKNYNRRWAKREGLAICWIKGAGHNSNTDNPKETNHIIRDFISLLQEKVP